jgi:hypothetical protein
VPKCAQKPPSQQFFLPNPDLPDNSDRPINQSKNRQMPVKLCIGLRSGDLPPGVVKRSGGRLPPPLRSGGQAGAGDFGLFYFFVIKKIFCWHRLLWECRITHALSLAPQIAKSTNQKITK